MNIFANTFVLKIDTILNLKQKQASIDSADSAAFQGNVVLVFTIVTIIFVSWPALAKLDLPY